MDLSLIASTRTIRKCINKQGWRKVNTKYCSIVNPINKIKRFIYGCTAKLNNEQFDNVNDIDECKVELRYSTYKNWQKSTNKLLTAHNGKFGKPKHQTIKVHLFGEYFAQRIVAFSNI